MPCTYVGAVVARRHFGEVGAKLAADTLRLLHQQMPDASVADAGLDDERHDPQDPVGMLESGKRVDRDEAEDLAFVVGHDH